MRVLLNNEPYEVPENPENKQASCSVKQLLTYKNWTFPLIIVKINDKLIRRDQWGTTLVADGDSVDAIHLVSGG